MSSVKYSDIFTGAQPTFEVTRAQKKANRSSLLSSSRSGDSQKTSSLNGKGTSNKVTPKRGTNENSKSGAKSPKLDAEALAKEFIKSVVFVIWICSYLSSRCFSFHCLKFWFWFFYVLLRFVSYSQCTRLDYHIEMMPIWFLLLTDFIVLIEYGKSGKVCDRLQIAVSSWKTTRNSLPRKRRRKKSDSWPNMPRYAMQIFVFLFLFFNLPRTFLE